MDDTRVDALLGGRLQLRQPRAGHRAGTDALLVAASAMPAPGDRVADVGCGVGTIGLALALREPGAAIRLIEREASLAALAGENAARNGCAARVALTVADIFDPDALQPLRHLHDLVVSNPPFFAAGAVRPSPQPLKARAYALQEGTHAGWLRALVALLAPRGRLVLIHRPEALPPLLAAAEGRLGALRLRPVLPRCEAPAIRILFAGVAGSRAPLEILPPLVLHEASGAAAPLAAALARGDAVLPLSDGPTRKSRPKRPASSSA